MRVMCFCKQDFTLHVLFQEHGSGTSDANQPEGHESELMAHLASQKQNRKNTQVSYSFKNV